jgi:hypothetical protein
MDYQLRRLIASYDRSTEELVETVELSEAVFESIRSLLGIPPTDPAYECYPIEGDQLSAAQMLLGRCLNENQCHFLESERVDE